MCKTLGSVLSTTETRKARLYALFEFELNVQCSSEGREKEVKDENVAYIKVAISKPNNFEYDYWYKEPILAS